MEDQTNELAHYSQSRQVDIRHVTKRTTCQSERQTGSQCLRGNNEIIRRYIESEKENTREGYK